MTDLLYLRDLVIILGFGIIIVIAFQRFKLPAIAGFIVAGVLVGPRGLGLIGNSHHVEMLAEIGVALLLFGIGSELPLTKLRRLWRVTLVGGLLQVVLTVVTVTLIGLAFDLTPYTALFVGLVVALSSTAVVLRGLQQRGEVDAPHGRLILGILVFQDFSVIPYMFVIPFVAGTTPDAGPIFLSLVKSIGLILVIVLSAVLVVPRLLNLVAQSRQRQLFILAVFVICLGTAWLVTVAGASLAIGAFLAGLVVAGSEYRHQALAEMIAFREIFASLFFVSVGMFLSPSSIIHDITPILIILAGIVLIKAAIVYLTASIMKMSPRVALITALALAQVGEFSLVILFAVRDKGLVDAELVNGLLTAAILSMLVTPFLISHGPKLAAGLGRFSRIKQLSDIESAEDASQAVKVLQNHIIVAGYGFAGRELCYALKECGIAFIVIDLNIENFRTASREVGNAVYGDITSESVLIHLGIERARELVLLINDPTASALAVHAARSLAPSLYISVRTGYLLDLVSLRKAGADEVIAAEQEAAVYVATSLLQRNQISPERTRDIATIIRQHSDETR